jgi:hypothetical protein
VTRRTIPALAAALLALSAVAPAHAAMQSGTIVVTGKREVPAPVARRYVVQITSSVEGQLARFVTPVCPLVIGMAPEYADIIARRIRTVAAEARVPLARPGCTANLIVAFATDADSVTKALRLKLPGLFAGVDDMQEAMRSGPVHSWASTVVLNEDGQMQKGKYLNVRSASILTLPTQQAVVGSMTVIDANVTYGKTLRQIGDYAAMRALAGARPPVDAAAVDTILTLFEPGGTPPQQMTGGDRSYLKALYKNGGNASAVQMMNRIAVQVAQDSRPPREEKR